MKELPKGGQVKCEWFLNELEGLPVEGLRSVTVEVLLRRLPGEAREHAGRCTECEAAVRDYVETRSALEGMQGSLPEAGPWFARRVMQAIAAREAEIEERKNGFWTGVRRLAPRLVAFATLLLVLGGTWAFQERREARVHGAQLSATEGIFETTPATPVNDDVIASVHEVPLP